MYICVWCVYIVVHICILLHMWGPEDGIMCPALPLFNPFASSQGHLLRLETSKPHWTTVLGFQACRQLHPAFHLGGGIWTQVLMFMMEVLLSIEPSLQYHFFLPLKGFGERRLKFGGTWEDGVETYHSENFLKSMMDPMTTPSDGGYGVCGDLNRVGLIDSCFWMLVYRKWHPLGDVALLKEV
jgi:hypothetical protein